MIALYKRKYVSEGFYLFIMRMLQFYFWKFFAFLKVLVFSLIIMQLYWQKLKPILCYDPKYEVRCFPPIPSILFIHGFQHAVQPLSSRLHDRMIQTTHSSVIFEPQSSKNSMKNLFICVYIVYICTCFERLFCICLYLWP